MQKAERITKVPPYLFAAIDKKKAAAIARGVDIISLGIGDPDLPTPDNVVQRMQEAVTVAGYHRYPAYEGAPAFRQAAAGYYRKRFGVDLDPNSEVLALIGSKEGLAHLIWAYVDPGDIVLVPDPGYPVYKTHTHLAGGIPYYMPLERERGYLPDLDAIPEDVARQAVMMFLNYPNNPTAGVATLEFFERAVAFCRKHDILLCHDAAYVEMTFDGYVAPSVLQIPGAKDVAVETYSLSKPFNMTGWRIAFVAGNADAVAALGIIKTNTDSGQFTAIQDAAIEALSNRPEDFFARMNEVYARRRGLAVAALREIGLEVDAPKGSFYLWVPTPPGHSSTEFAELLLDKAGVIVTPGSAYGEHGEGYIRLALTVGEARLVEALDRIRTQVSL